MRYLLVVGFACDVYRREPRARIFVGDKLIDDFYIPHTPDNLSAAQKNFFTTLHLLQPFSGLKLQNFLIKNFPPLRFYEVDIDKRIKNLILRINIDNSDSNYSNGFMTKSTLIKLKIFYFFPFEKRVLLRLKEIRDKNRISKNYSWYRSNKNYIYDVVKNPISWKGLNRQFENISGELLSQFSVGGNGDYISELIKKYGIFMPTLARSCRYSLDWDITSFLFDKYRQYENQ